MATKDAFVTNPYFLPLSMLHYIHHGQQEPEEHIIAYDHNSSDDEDWLIDSD